MQQSAGMVQWLRVMVILGISAQGAHASDWLLANEANEASWSYVRNAIGSCTEYATSIPKAAPNHALVQVRVQQKLLAERCKVSVIVANSITPCFFTPEQRQEIQYSEGTAAISRLLKDENTCGTKAEQQVMASIPKPAAIEHMPVKEPIFVQPAPEKKREGLIARVQSMFSFTEEAADPETAGVKAK